MCDSAKNRTNILGIWHEAENHCVLVFRSLKFASLFQSIFAVFVLSARQAAGRETTAVSHNLAATGFGATAWYFIEST